MCQCGRHSLVVHQTLFLLDTARLLYSVLYTLYLAVAIWLTSGHWLVNSSGIHQRTLPHVILHLLFLIFQPDAVELMEYSESQEMAEPQNRRNLGPWVTIWKREIHVMETHGKVLGKAFQSCCIRDRHWIKV